MSEENKDGARNGANQSAKSEAPSMLERDADFEKTPEQIVEEELELVRAESKENYDKYLRALAELENFKKRTAKERADLLKYQGERIIADLLEVADDLERALQHADSDPQHLKEGIELIYKRFIDTLSKWEVKAESSVGKEFNPSLHNAISKVPAGPDVSPGTIISELKKVFFYKDKILRHGQVVVADTGAQQTDKKA